MIKEIDRFLKSLTSNSLDKLDVDYIYKELICHENKNLNLCVKDTLRVFADLNDTNRRRVKFSGDSIIMSNIDESLCVDKKKIELGVFFKLENVSSNIDTLIEYFDKKKIHYDGSFDICYNVGYLKIGFIDIDVCLKVIDYINSKFKDDIYSVNPLFFKVDNVMVSLYDEYSYIELLSMYLYDFIMIMNELKKEIDYSNFKNFMLNKYYKIDNQIDMYEFLSYNKMDIKLSSFFNNLYEITNLILYLFDGSDFDEFKDYIRKLNRKKKNKYLIYDSLDDCFSLLNELVEIMYLNYGELHTRENIINYRDTGNIDYVTRKGNLRRKVMSSKTFMIYLRSISLEIELDKIMDLVRYNVKKKILEDVMIETYRVSWSSSNMNYAKIQVARCLIRMECDDYSSITRNNGARKKAIDNIDSKEIFDLIKCTLNIEYIKNEEEIYELYADYIENLCVN